jgi:outer membrane immunogenic protein
MNTISFAACAMAFTLSAGVASAAPPLPPIPPVYAPPQFTWSGFYAGVNIGYGFGNNDPDYGAHSFYTPFPVPTDIVAGALWSSRVALSGVVGGGQIGYNYQFNPWLVVGVEADIQGAGLSSKAMSISTPDPAVLGLGAHFGTINATQNVDWFGTVRGRIGVAPFNARLLIYGTGGFAYGGVDHLFQYADTFPTLPSALFGSTSVSSAKTGWTVGGGVEYSPFEFPNWSLKAEYLYVDLGKTNLATFGSGLLLIGAAAAPGGMAPGVFVAAHDPATRFHVVRVGLNYHFNLFGGAPIIASY